MKRKVPNTAIASTIVDKIDADTSEELLVKVIQKATETMKTGQVDLAREMLEYAIGGNMSVTPDAA